MYLHAFSHLVESGAGGDDRVPMSGAPLFHIAGVSGFYSTLVAGGTTVLSPSGGFDPGAMVGLLERERVSTVFLCRRSGPRSSPCPTSPSATSRHCAGPSGARRRRPRPCCAR